ncbi:MAG: response regulator transcription factor [Eubacteriales bacterium]|nr:response regulator transcription factor [Eubacteriales bacterium]MDY6315001.1 response regulator transcription factor [Clostridia bacterium]
MKILVADDDKNICELIGLYLQKDGYEPIFAYDGAEAVEKFKEVQPSLVVLDLMLPKLDGYGVCREIRQISKIPIIMLTARGETFDKVLGLEMGADDYMVKPFDGKELVARIKAVMRRYEPGAVSAKEAVFPGLSVSLDTYELKVDGTTVEMPPKELELLYFLCSHPNQVFTRDQLLDKVWGFDYVGETRTVDVHIKRVREKIGSGSNWELKTIYSVGYKFEVKSNA